MARRQTPYSAEYRQQIVELVHAGRTPEDLAREFEPSAQTIHNWVRQAERDAEGGDGGATSAERQELHRLRKENMQLRQERKILSKARGLVCQSQRVDAVLSTRMVPLPEDLYAAIMALPPTSFWVFPSPGNPQQPIAAIRKALANAVRQAGVTRNGEPMDLPPNAAPEDLWHPARRGQC